MAERVIRKKLGMPAGKPREEIARIQRLKRRSTKATPQGFAWPERVEYLREMLRDRLGWVEVYRDGNRPDRYGNITDEMIEEARRDPLAGKWNATRLEMEREYCLIRWRTWLDTRLYGSVERARRLRDHVRKR